MVTSYGSWKIYLRPNVDAGFNVLAALKVRLDLTGNLLSLHTIMNRLKRRHSGSHGHPILRGAHPRGCGDMEKHRNFQMDIECGWDDNEVYIVLCYG